VLLNNMFCAVFLPLAHTPMCGVWWGGHRWANTWSGSWMPPACRHTWPTSGHDGERTCWCWECPV